MFISPKLAKVIVDAYLFVNRQRKTLPPLNDLTSREKEIVRLIIDGKKSKEIADTLFISVKTVHKHRSNILEKLGLNSLADLRHRKMYILDNMLTD
jgi:DNA-binding NarL/FixJ family response regulator